MQDHLIIINIPTDNAVEYLTKLIDEVRISPELADIPVQILTDDYKSGLPPLLTNRGVVHRTGIGQNNVDLAAVDVNIAKYIILLAKDISDVASDSLSFDVLCRIKEIGTKAFIVAEVVDDANRQRMLTVGAGAVIRPIRAYPEFPVRSLVAPGTEQVLERMFTHEGDHLVRFDVNIHNLSWSETVCRVISHAGCLPVAYLDENGRIDTNPMATTTIKTQSLICLVNEEMTGIDNSTISSALS